jgi:hypothetical protein
MEPAFVVLKLRTQYSKQTKLEHDVVVPMLAMWMERFYLGVTSGNIYRALNVRPCLKSRD